MSVKILIAIDKMISFRESLSSAGTYIHFLAHKKDCVSDQTWRLLASSGQSTLPISDEDVRILCFPS